MDIIANRKPNIYLMIAVLCLALVLGGLIYMKGMIGLAIGWALVFFLLALFFIFKEPFVGLLLITFFLPLERFGSVEVAAMTLRLSQVFGLITILAWFLRMLMEKRVTLRFNPLFIPLVLFFLVNLLSFTQAVNLLRAETVFIFTLFTALVGMMIPQLVDTKEKLDRLIRILLISVFLVLIFGIFQFAGDLVGLPTSITGLRDLYTKEVFGFPRVQSTFLEPLYLANYLLIPLCIALAFLLSGLKKYRWWWLGIILILGLINFVLALSRAAYMALAFSFLVLIVYYLKKFLTPKRILGLIVVLVLVYFVVLRIFGLTQDVNLSLEKFGTQATSLFSGASYTDRAETFSQAWTSFKLHPYLGIGTGNFGPSVAWYPLIQPESGWLIVNNIYLEVAAETGVLGIALFFIILIILLARSIEAIKKAQDKYLKTMMIGLSAAFLGVLVQYNTFSILYIMHVWFLFGLMVAVQNLILNKDTKI